MTTASSASAPAPPARQPATPRRLLDLPLVRLLAYYAFLGVLTLVLHAIAPDLPGLFRPGLFDRRLSGGTSLPEDDDTATPGGNAEAALEALIAMAAAFLLMLPVAWLYISTRRKRGYQQSLVQTLVVLPIVVAGVVILVKGSVALAFSLGGIVGAIAFRNRLDDTKDAVHIFLGIGVGVACGVQMLAVALALSGFYNVVNLGLWWLDFGRIPADLAGPPAERRLAHLKATPDHRGDEFLSRVDNLLLQSMTPEQLASLAGRAEKRRQRFADEIGLQATGELRQPRFDGTLRLVAAPGDITAARRATEDVLASDAKFWKLDSEAMTDGKRTLVYKVRTRKSIPAPRLLKAVQRAIAPRATAQLD